MQLLKRICKVSLIFITINFLSLNLFAEEPIHPGYPFVFDMSGKIERYEKNELVIEDVLFLLNHNTTYHSHDSFYMTQSSIKKGDVVGLILEDKQTREIKSVWLIKKAD